MAATSPGCRRSSSGDYAWVQHMIRSMAPRTGRMAVVLPHGALFRMGAEGKIRRKILEMDLLEAVIGLGPNLFYGTGLAACILVFRERKRPERAGPGADRRCARSSTQRGRNQNTLEPEHAEQILAWYRDYRGCRRARRTWSTLDEIAAQRLESEHPALRRAGHRGRDADRRRGDGESQTSVG